MQFVRPPWWLRMFLNPGAMWRVKNEAADSVYLTFDDGPHPVATPFVLEQLALAGGAGTFFCIGRNVRRYGDIYQNILAAGHMVGNHTEHHVNGWKCSTGNYLEDVRASEDVVSSRLFRPPYGLIRPRAARTLRRKGYSIVMWDVLTWDFDTALAATDCLQKAKKHIRPGSIIVFHDSEKAWPRMKEALPGLIAYIQEKGWEMKALPAS